MSCQGAPPTFELDQLLGVLEKSRCQGSGCRAELDLAADLRHAGHRPRSLQPPQNFRPFLLVLLRREHALVPEPVEFEELLFDGLG